MYIQYSVTEIRCQLLYMSMYHSVEVNDVDIIHTSLVPSSKQHCSPVIYCSEGEGSTWRRSLSSGSRTAPHTCSGDKIDNTKMFMFNATYTHVAEDT